jgi:hypothetical protein
LDPAEGEVSLLEVWYQVSYQMSYQQLSLQSSLINIQL